MPDVTELSDEERAAFLGCIQAKNNKYKKENNVREVPQNVIQRHFKECSQSLGLED